MSEENLEGVADVLEEMAAMKAEDPAGYEAMLEDLRGDTPSEADIAARHGQSILTYIDGARTADPIIEMLQQAHAEAAASEGEKG